LSPNTPILARGLFALPDPIAREGSHLWEDGVTPNTCAITRADVGDCEDIGQMAMVS